ncbi:MAG: hypothetical protein AAFZ18_28740 [Myxococcota bacterium]
MRTLLNWTFFAIATLPGVTLAQSHDLPFVQAGASLGHAEMEVRILHAAITAKNFDLGFTKATLEEVGTALRKAKTSIDRAETLLPEKLTKMGSRLLAVREKIVAAESQLDQLGAAIVTETRVLTIEDEDEAAELPPTNWGMLERQTGWLAVDVAAAAGAYGKLRGPLKVKVLKKVRAPRGKREAMAPTEAPESDDGSLGTD